MLIAKGSYAEKLWENAKSISLRTFMKHVPESDIESEFPGSISNYKNKKRLINFNSRVRKATEAGKQIYLIQRHQKTVGFIKSGEL